MNTITPAELKEKIHNHQPHQLVDVREPHEHQVYNIGGILIPMDDIFNQSQTIKKDIPVIFYCKLGIRSQIVIQRLEDRFGFTNLFNLQGGMERWKKEIDGIE
jgi:adenylyltransferase/sulfurtransferase